MCRPAIDPRMDGRRAFDIAIVASLLAAAVAAGLGAWAGSMVVLAVAADKLADAAMSALNRWAYQSARQAPDDEHPYGHGKIEVAVSLGQALVLGGIVVSVLAGAVDQLVRHEGEPPDLWLALPALVGTGVVSLVVSMLLARAGRDTDALSMQADAAHYRVDVLHTGAAVIGLVLVGLTGQAWIDPVAALFFAGLMSVEAWRIGRQAVVELIDTALDETEQAAVEQVLDGWAARLRAVHGLRTRKAGPQRFVEVHVVLDPELPLGEAHELVQTLGDELRTVLPDGARVLVHPDAAGREDRFDHPLEELAPGETGAR